MGSAFDNRFARNVVLVTGAGSGIGLSIARQFLKAGATVIVNDIGPQQVEAGLTALASDSRDCAHGFAADVRDPDQVRAMVASITARHGAVDILVNNAGVYPDSLALEMTVEEWDQVMDTNVKGAFLVSQAVARAQVARGGGGCIVNIASGSYASAREGCAHYCASKAALVMLTKVLAMEFARHRIRVNAVAPGLIDVRDSGSTLSDAYMQATLSQIPWSREGRPNDVAHAVLMLALPEADYITGAVLAVDGGLSLGRYGIPRSARDG